MFHVKHRKDTMTIRPIALPLPTGLTHYEALICMWLGSDPPLLEQMRLLAAPDERTGQSMDVYLAAEVLNMLYSPEYNPANGRPIPDLLKVMQNCGDPDKARIFRSSVTRRDICDIDMDGWARIRTALLA
jgi:hypothetical protein